MWHLMWYALRLASSEAKVVRDMDSTNERRWSEDNGVLGIDVFSMRL